MNQKYRSRLFIIICSVLSFIVLAVFIYPLQASIDVNTPLPLQNSRKITVYWGYFWFYLLYGLWILIEPQIIKLFHKKDRK